MPDRGACHHAKDASWSPGGAGGRAVDHQSGPAFYDGRRFTPLPLPAGGASTWVQGIAVAQDGAVWFGMVTGHVFRYAAGAFTRFGAAEGLAGLMVTAYPEGSDKHLHGAREVGLHQSSENKQW